MKYHTLKNIALIYFEKQISCNYCLRKILVANKIENNNNNNIFIIQGDINKGITNIYTGFFKSEAPMSPNFTN